ncbi:MAG: sensor histidine kinase [Methylococcaceae bacterium]|nr:sensor histidine kinase [Methylococcaceae bacterium]
MQAQVLPKSQISIRENLQWLFILRNLMIISEAGIVFLAVFGLGIKLPQQELWLVILSIMSVNCYTWMRLKTAEDVTEIEIFSQLVVDVFGITSMLYLTGGASNPIIWVYLLPLIVTGIMLPQAYAWNMVILTSSLYTILIAYNIPLPSIEPHLPNPDIMTPAMQHKLHIISDKNYFNLHIFGMWFGFVFSAGLVAYFVVELSKTLRDRERTLAEAREDALRNDRVVSLATLAASAAHDMGTPLGTMAIVSHEVLQDFPAHRYPDLHEKITILEQQIARCKAALSVMSASSGEMRAESGEVMGLVEYIDEVLSQWRTQKPSAKLSLVVKPCVYLPSQIIAERTLTHSIINILNNAAEATDPDKGIELHTQWDNKQAVIEVRDFGHGLPPELLSYTGAAPMVSKKQGLGVGLFLTCTTIQRIGGTIEFYNHEKTGGGCVEITLPLINNEESDDRI